MRLLIGVDDSPESKDAISTAFKFFGSAVHYTVVSVGETRPLISTAYAGGTFASAADLTLTFDEAESAARSRAHDAAESLPVAADVEGRTGHAGTALCQTASEFDVDAIVIGSHDKNVWERLLQPSVGRFLIDNAPCPVIVVR